MASTSRPRDQPGLAAADFAALRNDWPSAFALGIDVVRVTSGDEREAARARVLEYFLLAGDDPAVPRHARPWPAPCSSPAERGADARHAAGVRDCATLGGERQPVKRK